MSLVPFFLYIIRLDRPRATFTRHLPTYFFCSSSGVVSPSHCRSVQILSQWTSTFPCSESTFLNLSHQTTPYRPRTKSPTTNMCLSAPRAPIVVPRIVITLSYDHPMLGKSSICRPTCTTNIAQADSICSSRRPRRGNKPTKREKPDRDSGMFDFACIAQCYPNVTFTDYGN